MSSEKLPPLNALKFFEIAGLHSSFKVAAEKLNVTPGAVSRQIAVLEEYLGVRLFKRHFREVTLTQDGRMYLDSVRQALDRVRTSTQELMQARAPRPLHIWCPMTFGMRWLAPRLPYFRAQHRDIEVVITTALSPVNVDLYGRDVAIQIGRGKWTGVISRKLVSIELMPVCSPRLINSIDRFATTAELHTHTLLQSAARPDYWNLWLKGAAVEGIDPSHGVTVESVSLAYQLAAEGAGVAMGQHALVEADLASGRLTAPFEHVEPIEDAFYLIYPSSTASSARVQAFADWVIETAAADEKRRQENLAQWNVRRLNSGQSQAGACAQ